MANIIHKYGTIGENPNFGGSGTLWTNPQYATNSDSLVASTTFTSSNLSSNYLYVRNFLMGLDDGAIIDGIQVTIRKRGIGAVIDNYVGLVYGPIGSLNITDPNKANANPWANLNTTVVYGGPTDLWGRTWSYSDLDSPQFGVVISATGDGVGTNGAEVDYILVDVYYHDISYLSGSGGVYGKGGAFKYAKYHVVARGNRLSASGRAFSISNEVSSGGGSIYLDEVISGGALSNGSADVNVVYGTAQKDLEFYITPEKEIPKDIYHPNALAISYISLDNNTLYGKIRHNLPNLDVVRLRGPANEKQIANTIIALDGLVPLASPIHFSIPVSPTQVTDILNGKWYFYLLEQSTSTHIRSQLINYPIRTSGSADVASFIQLDGGGVSCNGTVNLFTSYGVTGSSGIVASGSANVSGSSGIIVSTGAKVGRGITADVSTVLSPEVVSSGVSINLSTSVLVKFNPIVSGDGPFLSGQVLSQITVPIGQNTAISLGGSVNWVKIAVPPIGGGIRSSGYYLLQQTYASHAIVGGVRVIGSWIGEKIKPLVTAKHLNYALVMASPNKLNTVKPKKTVLKTVDAGISPSMAPNSFQINHQPGYCDFGEQCDSAYLPPIVKKRQGMYLPPKNGSVVVSNDQIATLS